MVDRYQLQEASEFPDVTKDPVESRRLTEALKVFATGKAGGVLQEMAGEVLSGRITLSAAANVSDYSEAMISAAQPFSEQWHALSERDRGELAQQGVAELNEESVDAPHRMGSDQHSVVRGTSGRISHGGRDWSLY